MDLTKIKAHVFDAEQSLTFAREAIEEKDREALSVALHGAAEEIAAACQEVDSTFPPRDRTE